MQQDFLYLKHDKRCIQIDFADIHYIKAIKRYIKIVTVEKEHLIETSLSKNRNLITAIFLLQNSPLLYYFIEAYEVF